MKTQMTLIIFLMLTTHMSFAQDWTWYNNDNSGLPSNDVRDIVIDSINNDVWIATSQGLTRFDNQSWEVFNSANTGMDFNSVTAVAIDYNGDIWMGSPDALFHFDGENWEIFNENNSGMPELGAQNSVTRILVDESNSKWIGTGASGLIKFNDQDNQWQIYDYFNSEFPGGAIHDIGLSPDGAIWACASEGVLVIHENGNQFVYDDNNSPLSGVTAIYIKGEDVWFGTPEGLVYYNGEDWEIFDTTNSEIHNNWVRALEMDDSGNLWLALSGVSVFDGISVFDGENWVNFNQDNSNLPTNKIFQLAIDADNKIWGGSFDEGLGFLTYPVSFRVKSHDLKTLSVYPNPVNYQLTLNISHQNIINRVVLYDLLGNLIINNEHVTVPHQMDVKNLISGSYILIIQTESNLFTRKIIKK